MGNDEEKRDDSAPATPEKSKRRILVEDILVGLAIAGLIVLLAIFGTRAAPTFIYQAF